jgi:transcription factor CON7
LFLAEFKEIRKEWKAKKKEEEAQRKAEEERQRAEGRGGDQNASEAPVYGHMRPNIPPQLPPIGYNPAASTQAPPYGTQSPGTIEGMTQYANSDSIPSTSSNSRNSYPQSPYGQNQQMYQQSQS